MPAAAFRLLSFVALAAAAATLWLGFLHSTGGPVALTPALPPVGSQSIFVPAAAVPSPPAPPRQDPAADEQQPAPTEQFASGLTIGDVVTNPACGRCTVRFASGGVVRARVPAGSGRRQAYALLDLGNRAADARVLAHDVIAFGRGERPAQPLNVLQLLDSAHRVIFALVAQPSRRLYLLSPAGGLRRAALYLATGAIVPNDGISGVAVDVSAKANGFLAVYVNGVRTVALRTLSGATTTAPRYLATGVIGYETGPSASSITATHAQVSVSTSDAPVAPLAPAPPSTTPAPAQSAALTLVSLSPPTITGLDVVGGTLTADPGSWSDPQATLAYAWQRCDGSGSCTPIDTATDRTYTLARADRDAFVRVRVTARSGSATVSKTSAAVGPVMRAAPSALTLPQVFGQPVSGEQLTADPGTWSDPDATFTYAWQRCDASHVCTTIDGATGPAYTPTSADVGGSIRVEVTATNVGGTSTVDSATTDAVRPAPPTLVIAPSVDGEATVGSTLTADPGSWSDPDATFAYAWHRCDDTGACTPVAGATDPTYVVGNGDLGFRVGVTVSAVGAGGTGTADSPPTAPVAAAVPVPPAMTVSPSIEGEATVGSALTADPGTWSDPSASFGFSWQRCDRSGSCTSVDGATAGTYTVTADDLGWSLRVEVTATGVDGAAATAGSAPVGPVTVPPPPSSVSPPAVSGDATVGSTLTADPGSWTGPTPTITYTWQRCDGNGSCATVADATERTYTLTTADLGSLVRVEVTAANAGGTGNADSAAIGPVEAPPVDPANGP